MKQLLSKFIFTNLLVFLTCSVMSNVSAQSNVEISWDASTEFEVVGYRVYLGETSGEYDRVFDVIGELSVNLVELEANTDYFVAVTAFDTFHNESPLSQEITFTTPSDTGDPQFSVSRLQVFNLDDSTDSIPIILFRISGADNDTVQVRASSNLSNWEVLGDASVNARGLLIINDPAAKGENKRFYQIVRQ